VQDYVSEQKEEPKPMRPMKGKSKTIKQTQKTKNGIDRVVWEAYLGSANVVNFQSFGSSVHLTLSDRVVREKNLPVQVRHLYYIIIYEYNLLHLGSRK